MKEITIDGTDKGRIFQGIAGIFSNGMTKLLRDYPKEQREDILRFLFEDNFGASLHHVKVEIGSDVNTSSGTVPSHMRDRDDFDIKRGDELWICSEAKRMNPQITTEALRWGTPAWIQNGEDKYLYYCNFLKGAKEEFGITFDYLGCDQNEGDFDRDWVVNTLKPNLVRDGFGDVKLVAADGDGGWQIADDVLEDEALDRAVDVLNCHYTVESTKRAVETSKPLWAGEHLAAVRHDFKKGPLYTAYLMAAMYPIGRMTMYEMHPALEANYPTTPFSYKGMIAASWPWSGHYEVTAGLWAAAHFTQFIKPGWQYLDGACFAGDQKAGEELSACAALKAPDGRNWSMVLVNGGEEKEYDCRVCGGLNSSRIHVWVTEEKTWFEEKETITTAAGRFLLRLPAHSICSLTTLTGQKKGKALCEIPEERRMKLPWNDDFSGYEERRKPLYTSDQGGAFELGKTDGKMVLQQKITKRTRPVDWVYRTTPLPYTLIGSELWANYGISAEILLPAEHAFAWVAVRCVSNGKFDVYPDGYLLRLTGDGAWTLQRQEEVLAAGKLTGFNRFLYHRLSLRAEGERLCASLNGKILAVVNDSILFSGQAAIGSSLHEVCFTDLSITGCKADTDCLRYGRKEEKLSWHGNWIERDGNYATYERRMVCAKEAGAWLEFAFDGTSVAITGNRDRDGGIARLWVDGFPVTVSDTFCVTRNDRKTGASVPKSRNVVAAAFGLKPGRHTVKLEVTGEKNRDSGDSVIAVDGVEICGGSGLVDKTI